jgi:uncharacterized membrane protein YfcA
MDYSWLEILLRLLTGLVIGFFIALTGVGGGSLVVPVLTILLYLPSSVAVGTASLYAFLTKIYAVYEHTRLKTIDMPSTTVFLAGALPANIIVSFLITNYIRNAELNDRQGVTEFQEHLMLFIAVVLLVSIVPMVLNLINKRSAPQEIEFPKRTGKKHQVLGALCGAVVGGVMGATSVGGGVLVVPVLIMLFGLSANKTVGTSIVIALVLSLNTTVIYLLGGQMEYLTALLMWLGSIGGVHLGSRLSARMPERPLQAIVISVIFAAALSMFVQVMR